MRIKTLQPTSRFIQACQNTPLFSHAQMLGRLQARLKNQLPEPMHAQCHIVNLRDNTLILAASSPVWATRLRFLAPQLGTRLGQEIAGKPLKIKIKVQPSSSSPKVNPGRRASISTATGKLLEQIAADIKHPDLRASLVRIAAHARKV